MTTFKVSDLKQFLATKNDDLEIPFSTLEYMATKVKHNAAIVNIIKSSVDNYTPLRLKQDLVKQITPAGIITELIPTIALGRRAGHSTAAINYAKQVVDRQVYIVTYNNGQVRELTKLLGPTTMSKTYYYHALNNVTVMDLQCALRNLSRVAPEDSIIIFDSSFAYQDPSVRSIISELYLYHSVIFLGN